MPVTPLSRLASGAATPSASAMTANGTAATDAGRKPVWPASGVVALIAASLCSDTWFSVGARGTTGLGPAAPGPLVVDRFWPKQTPKKLT